MRKEKRMMIEQRQVLAAPADPAQSAFWAWARRLHDAWLQARTRVELHALSDRTLKDIGLRRDEIDSLLR